MPSLLAPRLAYLAGEVYTDCFCIRIVKADGTELYFTTYHTDIAMATKRNFGSPELISPSPVHVYQSDSGYQATAMAATATLAIDNLDIAAIYANSGITQADLLAGEFDGAVAFIFLTDYTNPIEDEHPLKKAVYGQILIRENDFIIEFRSLKQLLLQEVGTRVTITDRFTIGDAGVDLAPPFWQTQPSPIPSPRFVYVATESGDHLVGDRLQPTTENGFWFKCIVGGEPDTTEPTWPTTEGGTVVDNEVTWEAYTAYVLSGTVSTVVDNGEFQSTNRLEVGGYWSHGVVTWLTGNNAGKQMEVRQHYAVSPHTYGVFLLFLHMPYDIEVGDTYTIQVGYDRRFIKMQTKFDNVKGFGGFPHVPGPTAAGKFGGQ